MAEKRKKKGSRQRKVKHIQPPQRAPPLSKQIIDLLTLLGHDLTSIRKMLHDSDPAYMLPHGVIARFTVAGLGYVDIRTKSDMQFLVPLIRATGQNLNYQEISMMTEAGSDVSQDNEADIDAAFS